MVIAPKRTSNVFKFYFIFLQTQNVRKSHSWNQSTRVIPVPFLFRVYRIKYTRWKRLHQIIIIISSVGYLSFRRRFNKMKCLYVWNMVALSFCLQRTTVAWDAVIGKIRKHLMLACNSTIVATKSIESFSMMSCTIAIETTPTGKLNSIWFNPIQYDEYMNHSLRFSFSIFRLVCSFFGLVWFALEIVAGLFFLDSIWFQLWMNTSVTVFCPQFSSHFKRSIVGMNRNKRNY